MNGVHNYASTVHSSFSPMATTRPTSPTPADGRTPAASSQPSVTRSAPPRAATEPATNTTRLHNLSSTTTPGDPHRGQRERKTVRLAARYGLTGTGRDGRRFG